MPQGQEKWIFVGTYFFERKDPSHQEVASRLWKESGKYIDYLGEWHTHRQPWPTPSSLDCSEWKKIGNMKRPLSIVVAIVGLEGVWMGIVRKEDIFTLVSA